MMRWGIHVLLIFLGMAALSVQATAVVSTNGIKKNFNAEKANQQFDKIALKLSTENLNFQTLNQSINDLNELAKKAQGCVQDTKEEINDIEGQIKKYFGEKAEDQLLPRQDLKYLEDQKNELINYQAQCQLFMIRANEALDAYKATASTLQQKRIFSQGDPIFERIKMLPNDLIHLNYPTIDIQKLNDKGSYLLYGLLPILLIAMGISWRLRRLMHRTCRKNMTSLLFNTVNLFFIFLILGNILFLSAPFILDADNERYINILWLSLAFISVLFFYNFLFLLRRLPSILEWYGFDVIFLKQLGLTVLTIYFIRTIGLNALLLGQASENLLQLYEDLMLILSLIAMTYFTLILYHRHSEWFKARIRLSALYQVIGLIVVTLLLLNFVGFSHLSVSVAHILFSSLLVGALGTVLYLGISNAYHVLCYNNYYQTMIKRFFGFVGEPPFIELLILKIILQMVVIVGMVFLLIQIGGEASYYINIFFENLIYGFGIGGFEFLPVQWLIGLLVFCSLSLLSRRISTKISRSQQFDDEEEKQVAIASIILYFGLTLSVIIALLFAGFSFTNLAIIAGALSVGIGLGLQSIVNNFFSGLILLIEKPIKPGDRIKVDNIEGFVKKVRVRSTQVVTPAKEDIIIPNSDLITHQVTNYMFNDKFCRIKCEIGVGYESDVDLVSKVIMDVGLSHPEVIKSKKNKPLVLFRAFGESALQFELWCLIKDVNNKYIVASELNFALNKACREHNINIAFPQRDVHLHLPDDSLKE